MSNIVRKGDFLVFEDTGGNVTEFFVSKGSFDLDSCYVGITGRKRVYGCFGFRFSDGFHYVPGFYYWITRKATLEERGKFLQWMAEKGYKINLNTMKITLNR